MRSLFVTVGLVVADIACAATSVFSANNPGVIEGLGRQLTFDLSTLTGEVRSARLELDFDYTVARELTLTLNSNGQILPLAQFPSVGGSSSLRGTYRFEDGAVTTWLQLEAAAGGGVIDSRVPARAFQSLGGEQCLNLLARFIEFDIDRMQPLRLDIDRFAAPGPGGGSIAAARLIVDTEAPDRIAYTGFDEPSAPIVRCLRPSLDLLVNGMVDQSRLSPIALIDFAGENLSWFVRQRVPLLDVGPILFASSDQEVYAGRFGGRSRMNFGVFDAASGTVTFSTGTGGRTISIEGDWLSVPYRTLPGDYDGDGITDVALAYLDGGSNRWIARIRFSNTGQTRDYTIDPRTFDPNSFTSGAIGWGAGQDSDRDGRDEIVGYAEFSAAAGMSYLQLVPDPNSTSITLFRTGSFGQRGDQLVLGKWQLASHNAMRVFRVNGFLRWQQFGSSTAFAWGDPGDLPMSVHVDSDLVNDIAVFRPSTGEVYAIASSNGAQVTIPALTAPAPLITPLGFLQGVTAPLEQ